MGTDISYMHLALQLAKKGQYTTSPNPMVGCVISNNNETIATGWHKGPGSDHAEIAALKSINYLANNAVLYINLEPCCHYGNAPPCVNSIIKAKIKKVVIGTVDPNPLVSGKGIELLLAAGIEVKLGVLEKECEILNKFYIFFMRHNRPYIIAKWAMSLDGKSSVNPSDSRQISNKKSQKHAHQTRALVDAIVIGSNTAKQDNPQLTIRAFKPKTIIKNIPKRIILDSKGSTPSNLILYTDDFFQHTIVVTTQLASNRWINQLESQGVTILLCKANRDNKICLKDFIEKLYKLNIISVLIEGGNILRQAFLGENLVDECQVYLSNNLIADLHSKIPVEFTYMENLDNNYFFSAKVAPQAKLSIDHNVVQCTPRDDC